MSTFKFIILFFVLCAFASPVHALIVINPSDDGFITNLGNSYSINRDGTVFGFFNRTRGVVEFPLSGLFSPRNIQNARLSAQNLDFHFFVGNPITVYGYESKDGILTEEDYSRGISLGKWIWPENPGFGEVDYFDITNFLKKVDSDYVGFVLQTDTVFIFSSLEHNYGHPSQLLITESLNNGPTPPKSPTSPKSPKSPTAPKLPTPPVSPAFYLASDLETDQRIATIVNPEPASMLLFGTGLVGVLGRRRKHLLSKSSS